MMMVLGIGSAVALVTAVNTVLLDSFPGVKTIYISAISCVIGFAAGIIFVTPVSKLTLYLITYYIIFIQ